MTTVALPFLTLAFILGFGLPVPLARMAGTGASPRLGLAMWLTAIAGSLASAAIALGLAARAAATGWPAFARAICQSVAGGGCTAAVYRGAVFEFGLACAVLAGTAIAAIIGWRLCRSLGRLRARTRAHCEAARIAGRQVSGVDGAFILDAARPAVYCAPGRPATIVITTGALAILPRPQLAAVLAHERAHLAGRHHLLVSLTRSLAAAAPFIPLFASGAAEVGRLTEMRADDLAARHCGRSALLAALSTVSAMNLGPRQSESAAPGQGG